MYAETKFGQVLLVDIQVKIDLLPQEERKF